MDIKEKLVAKAWAKDYMARFEKMVVELENHKLVQNVRFNLGKPLTEEELNKVHEELGYQLDDYIVEFYKLNNGLQLHWNSYAARPEVDAAKNRQVLNIIKDYRRGNDDADAVEGWICLYPFDTFTEDYGGDLFIEDHEDEINYLKFYKDPSDVSMKVLDNFNYYCQTGFPINGDPNPCLFHFENYGACFSKRKQCNFVAYMEFILATYGYVGARTSCLHGLSTDLSQIAPVGLPKELAQYIKQEDSNIGSIINDHYHNKGAEYLNSLGGLWGLVKDLEADLQKKLFATLKLSDDDIEELREEYEIFEEEEGEED